MIRYWFSLFLCLSLFCTSSMSFAEESSNPDPIKMELIQENQAIQAGQPFWVILHLTIQDGWHSYWKNPGDSGKPLTIDWNLPAGFKTGSIEWPYPKLFTVDSSIGFGYEGEVFLLVQIIPPKHLPIEKTLPIEATVDWVACSNEACIPGSSTLSANVPISSAPPLQNEAFIPLFAKARAKLPQKHWNVVAQKNGDRIEILLHVPRQYNHPISKAYFYPESELVINHHVDTILQRVKGSRNQYSLLFQKIDKTGDIPTVLKGVLVLQVQENGQTYFEAIEVDVPIMDSSKASEPIVASTSPKVNVESLDIPPISVNSVEETTPSLLLALGLAFLGGLILNLMPCVLPVISLKILSFVKMAGQNRSTTLKHGLAFSLGIIVSFWVLAGILIGLQAYGQSVGWGFQLQHPLFVAILASILLILGLNLFGVFEMGTSLTSLAGQAQSSSNKQDGFMGSFLSGVLATAVATPCTGPFLGSAIGFAFTLPPILTLLIFTSLGIGMSLPYLLLSAFPSSLRFLPKPGNWMIAFKELMGFLMLATVVWLLWVFGAQTSTFAISSLLLGFLFLSLGCWIYGKWGTPVKSIKSRLISSVFAISCLVLCGYAVVNAVNSSSSAENSIVLNEANIWEEFSPERLQELQKQGVPVFVDFTAKWCLICQTNHMVLTSEEVHNKLKDNGVVKMKADWTKNDPVITEELKKFGRNGVPLYVLYGPDSNQPPQILPQMLTADAVSEHVDKMNKENRR